MRSIVVGVLRGGPSKEHDLSLKTGHAVLKHLRKDEYTARDIYIDKDGQWHVSGRPVMPEAALRSLDVAIVSLHGGYAEEGTAQKMLERFGVPYVGSRPFPVHISSHRMLTRKIAEEEGVYAPRYHYVEQAEDPQNAAAQIVRKFLPPVVVKPAFPGFSFGVEIASGHASLFSILTRLLPEVGGVLVEECVRGRKASISVAEGLRGEALYVFPPVEVLSLQESVLSHDKRDPESLIELCPGKFSVGEKAELARVATCMHKALGLRHYSRSDFIVSPGKVHYLKTNALPSMAEESHLQKSLAAVGVSFSDFLSHLITTARTRERYA